MKDVRYVNRITSFCYEIENLKTHSPTFMHVGKRDRCLCNRSEPSERYICFGDHIAAFVTAVRIQSPITCCVCNMLAAVT